MSWASFMAGMAAFYLIGVVLATWSLVIAFRRADQVTPLWQVIPSAAFFALTWPEVFAEMARDGE